MDRGRREIDPRPSVITRAEKIDRGRSGSRAAGDRSAAERRSPERRRSIAGDLHRVRREIDPWPIQIARALKIDRGRCGSWAAGDRSAADLDPPAVKIDRGDVDRGRREIDPWPIWITEQ
jgi:hypothetical protein